MEERSQQSDKASHSVDVLRLIDDLEEVIGAGWPVPGVGRAMVDVDKASEMLDALREHLPAELEQAREVMGERDRLLEQSYAEAQRIEQEAHQRASALVSQEGVYKTAERQARAMLEQAKARAEETRAKADEYAIDSLRALEARLTQTLATVQNGISSLEAQTPQDLD